MTATKQELTGTIKDYAEQLQIYLQGEMSKGSITKKELNSNMADWKRCFTIIGKCNEILAKKE